MKKRLAIALLLLLLLPAAAVLWLTYTASGLQFALEQLNHLPKMSVQLRGVRGRLAGPLHIDYFELDQERVHVVAQQIDIDLQPALLLSGLIALNTLNIAQAEVTLKRHLPGPDTGPPHFLPSFLRVNVDSLNLGKARFINYNGFILDATAALAQAALSHSDLQLRQLDVQTSWLAVQGEFGMRSATELELHANVAATLKPGHGTPLHSQVSMSGTLKLLNFAVTVQQPQAAQITAALNLSQAWLLNGDVVSGRWSLAPWLDKAPFSFRAVLLKFSMNDAGIHVRGEVVVPEWATQPLQVDAEGRYAARVITLKQADISAQRGSISTRTRGSITLSDNGLPTLDLHSSWRGLQWPLQVDAAHAYFTSASGTASLSGSLPYRFTTTAELTLPRLAATLPNGAVVNNHSVTASGDLTQLQVHIAHYDWQLLGGSANGSGQLQFALPRAWQLAVNAQDINPGLINAQWPGRLSVSATVSGENFTPQSSFDLKLQSLTGILRKQPIRAHGRIAHAQQTWQADDVAVDWGSASLRAAGTVGPQNNLQWTFNAPALQQLYPGMRGELAMTGQVKGATLQPRLALIAQSKHMEFAAWQLDGLSLDTQLDLTDHSASSLQLKAEQLSHGSFNLQQPLLSGNGQASAHELKFTSTVNAAQLPSGLQFAMTINGAYVAEQWQAEVKQLQVVDVSKVERVHLNQAATIALSAVHASLQTFCLTIDSGTLCAWGEWDRNALWQAHASLDALPVDLANTAWAQDARIHSLVNAQADFHGSTSEAWLGAAQLQLADASIRYSMASGREQALPINLGEVHLDADARSVRSTAQLAVSGDTTASLTAQLDRTASPDWQQWPLSGRAELNSADAKLVPVFVSEVDRASGMLTSALQFGGTLGDPLLSGKLQLKQGELDLYRLNLALRALQLDAELNNDQLQFTVQGNAGEGLLKSSGKLGWRDNQLAGQLQVQGDKLLVADLPEYHVLASPNLTFDIAKHNINVKGEVLIPSAKLQPKDITGAVQTSADTRFKSDKIFTRDSPWSISSNVTIRLGDDVQFDGLGLQGKLGGNVNTNLRTGNTASGRGELNIADGRYEAYGRKLDIKRGRLLFDDTPLDNPGLDIQAERLINEITVGVYVRGVLRDPRLQFYSDPTMSQTQIVSYMLVGKPLDELQSGEASTVKSASSSLALQGGGYLAAQLGRRVGLEEVGVETDTNNQQSFVLGKFLSPRLFVSYGISLTEAINTLKLRYTLSDHWTIKTEAGEAKSADVEFRINR